MASSVIDTQYLESLVNSLNTNPNEISSCDLVALLLYSLMVESGFQPCASPVNEDGLYALPSDWKDSENNLYRFTVTLGDLDEYKCRLVCFLVGDVVECNFIVSNVPDAVYSCTLHCSKVTQNVAGGSSVSRFRNLQQLSRELTGRLIYPVKTLILNAKGFLNPSLLGVPDEVKLKIMGYLSKRDISSLYKSCEYFKALISDAGLPHSADETNDRLKCYGATRPDGRMIYMTPQRPRKRLRIFEHELMSPWRRLRIPEPMCMPFPRFIP